MELARGTDDDKANVSWRKDDHENLVAYATSILKEENDKEVLESIVELLEDLSLRRNAEMREGLRGFKKNGWALIRRAQKQKSEDFRLTHTPTPTSSMALELKQGMQIMKSRLDHETHPMNIDLILKKIFELSSKDALKNCRLVSKKWCDLSLSSWRRKAVLKAWKLFEKSPDRVHWSQVERLAVERFNKNASKLLEIPFQSYNLRFVQGLDLDRMKSLEQKHEKMMLTYFSSSIQELRIKCRDFDILCLLLTTLPHLHTLELEINCSSVYYSYEHILEKSSEFPLENLQTATSKLCTLGLNLFNLSSYHHEIFDYRMTYFWRKIFKSVSAVKSFRFSSRRCDAPSKEVLESFCEVRKEGNFSTLNLEELMICPSPDYDAGCIVDSQLPLQTLCIDLRSGDKNNRSTISGLLEAHSETLQTINVGIYFDDVQRQRLPSLPLAPYLPSKVELLRVKELVLRNDCVWAFHLLSSLDVPYLESLKISSNNPISSDEKHVLGLILESDSFMRSYIFPNLNDFVCDVPVNFGVTELQIVAKSMPNWTRLCLPLGERTFPIVYQLWPKLQSLHLYATRETYSLTDDYGIVGFPIDLLGDQARLGSRVPNITDLKNLRKFVLETNVDGVRNLSRPNRACISDISVIYGFLQLPKLHFLQLDTICEFSPNVMLALKNHVPETKIREPDIFAPVPAYSCMEQDKCDHENGGESSSEESSNSD